MVVAAGSGWTPIKSSAPSSSRAYGRRAAATAWSPPRRLVGPTFRDGRQPSIDRPRGLSVRASEPHWTRAAWELRPPTTERCPESMLTIDEAFRRFKSRLELTDREQADASRRQREIREHMDTQFEIDHDF